MLWLCVGACTPTLPPHLLASGATYLGAHTPPVTPQAQHPALHPLLLVSQDWYSVASSEQNAEEFEEIASVAGSFFSAQADSLSRASSNSLGLFAAGVQPASAGQEEEVPDLGKAEDLEEDFNRHKKALEAPEQASEPASKRIKVGRPSSSSWTRCLLLLVGWAGVCARLRRRRGPAERLS